MPSVFGGRSGHSSSMSEGAFCLWDYRHAARCRSLFPMDECDFLLSYKKARQQGCGISRWFTMRPCLFGQSAQRQSYIIICEYMVTNPKSILNYWDSCCVELLPWNITYRNVLLLHLIWNNVLSSSADKFNKGQKALHSIKRHSFNHLIIE